MSNKIFDIVTAGLIVWMIIINICYSRNRWRKAGRLNGAKTKKEISVMSTLAKSGFVRVKLYRVGGYRGGEGETEDQIDQRRLLGR